VISSWARRMFRPFCAGWRGKVTWSMPAASAWKCLTSSPMMPRFGWGGWCCVDVSWCFVWPRWASCWTGAPNAVLSGTTGWTRRNRANRIGF